VSQCLTSGISNQHRILSGVSTAYCHGMNPCHGSAGYRRHEQRESRGSASMPALLFVAQAFVPRCAADLCAYRRAWRAPRVTCRARRARANSPWKASLAAFLRSRSCAIVRDESVGSHGSCVLVRRGTLIYTSSCIHEPSSSFTVYFAQKISSYGRQTQPDGRPDKRNVDAYM
jgi:hypothetical protein